MLRTRRNPVEESEARVPWLGKAEPPRLKEGGSQPSRCFAHAGILLRSPQPRSPLLRKPDWHAKGPLEVRQVPRKDADESPRTRHGGSRIRCPRCAWEPGREDLWMCTCLHLWNTFETRGICPACGREWKETQCPRCSAWSPHEDWYVDDSEPSA